MNDQSNATVQESNGEMTQLVRPCDDDGRENIARRSLGVEIPGQRRRGRPNVRWKDASRIDTAMAGL